MIKVKEAVEKAKALKDPKCWDKILETDEGPMKEIDLLKKFVDAGIMPKPIFDTGVFEGRSYRAIRQKCSEIKMERDNG